MSAEDTEGIHAYGHPMRSMGEAKEPSLRNQVKDESEGCRTRQISTTQQSRKTDDNKGEVSHEKYRRGRTYDEQ